MSLLLDDKFNTLTTDMLYWKGQLTIKEILQDHDRIADIRSTLSTIKVELNRLGDSVDMEI
jgi:hypothetical protein